jgi:hypothetical protein
MNIATRMPYSAVIDSEIDEGILEDIREDAVNAFFKTVADRFADYGFPLTGDFAPEELQAIYKVADEWLRSMALNNPHIAALNEEAS